MIEVALTSKYGKYLKGLDIYENKTSIILSKIIINSEFRREGIGSNIMNDLLNYADSNNKIIALTPSSDFGGNKNKLIQFYKKFGFKLNKGHHKSFEFRETMIRYPKMNETVKDKIKGGLADKISKKDIAKKFSVTLAKINKEVKMGEDVEMEHVTNKTLSREIAMDHLVEIPDYYTRLKKMEKEGEKYWKGKTKQLDESTRDFIKRRIRENVTLSVSDETPVTTAFNIMHKGKPAGQIEVGKFNQKLNDDDLEIIFIKVNEQFRGLKLGTETIQALWKQFPDTNRFILMPTNESYEFWEKMGATRLNDTYHMINRGH